MHWVTIERVTRHRRSYWKCRNIDVDRREEKWCGMYDHVCDNLKQCPGYRECKESVLCERAEGHFRKILYSSQIIHKKKKRR